MNISKEDIKYALTWSVIGSLLMVIGVIVMINHQNFNIEFPWYLIAGIVIMSFGFTCWLFVYKLKIYNKKLKQELKMKELELVEKGIIKYEDFVERYKKENQIDKK